MVKILTKDLFYLPQKIAERSWSLSEVDLGSSSGRVKQKAIK